MHPCDLTSPADVDRLLAFILDRHDGLDILVNAGAWGAFAPIEDMDFHSEWQKTLANELDVVFLACKAAWPHLKARGEVPSSTSPRSTLGWHSMAILLLRTARGKAACSPCPGSWPWKALLTVFA